MPSEVDLSGRGGVTDEETTGDVDGPVPALVLEAVGVVCVVDRKVAGREVDWLWVVRRPDE